MSKNAIYPIPIIGKYEFLKNEAQKIVPKIKYSDLWTVKIIPNNKMILIEDVINFFRYFFIRILLVI